jgi:hypothetical protein
VGIGRDEVVTVVVVGVHEVLQHRSYYVVVPKRMSEPSITGGPQKVGTFDRRIERGRSFARSDTISLVVPKLSRVNTADWARGSLSEISF